MVQLPENKVMFLKKLLWVGNPFFYREMAAFGWDVVYHSPETEPVTWADCIAVAQGEPDAVVVADMSRSPFVLGVESFPCPTVFYAVDTHIHSWMPLYAQAFDACLLSLKDHIPLFLKEQMGGRLEADDVHWFPAYNPWKDIAPESKERDIDLAFIGSMNESMPIRLAFIEELRRYFPDMLACFGNIEEYYARTKVAINVCEHGDLNFRVFESMGLGAALVTPAIKNGQGELFEEGRHLLTYPLAFDAEPTQAAREAAAEAATRIRFLLEHPKKLHKMAQTGFQEVSAMHKPHNRAEKLHNILKAFTNDGVAKKVMGRCEAAKAIREKHLKFIYLLLAEDTNEPAFKLAYMKAAKGI